jgi:hypothetical protein
MHATPPTPLRICARMSNTHVADTYAHTRTMADCRSQSDDFTPNACAPPSKPHTVGPVVSLYRYVWQRIHSLHGIRTVAQCGRQYYKSHDTMRVARPPPPQTPHRVSVQVCSAEAAAQLCTHPQCGNSNSAPGSYHVLLHSPPPPPAIKPSSPHCMSGQVC